MKLTEFAGILPTDAATQAKVDVTGITSNSMDASAGSLFFGVAGSKSDGAKYAPDAVRRGAVAVVVDNSAPVGALSVPVLRVPDSRRALALSAARYYGAQPQSMVAVTGTSGKTSVASPLSARFGNMSALQRPASARLV
jgi:UDP-N-acetylmuramoyl-L-alanyl-D-glutamate--2,6-diaminopimelate ligase